MLRDELTEMKRQRDGLKRRIQLMRDGDMTTLMGSPCVIDTTKIYIREGELRLAAYDRMIARRESLISV